MALPWVAATDHGMRRSSVVAPPPSSDTTTVGTDSSPSSATAYSSEPLDCAVPAFSEYRSVWSPGVAPDRQPRRGDGCTLGRVLRLTYDPPVRIVHVSPLRAPLPPLGVTDSPAAT